LPNGPVLQVKHYQQAEYYLFVTYLASHFPWYLHIRSKVAMGAYTRPNYSMETRKYHGIGKYTWNYDNSTSQYRIIYPLSHDLLNVFELPAAKN